MPTPWRARSPILLKVAESACRPGLVASRACTPGKRKQAPLRGFRKVVTMPTTQPSITDRWRASLSIASGSPGGAPAFPRDAHQGEGGGRSASAHCAVADGPRAGLQPLKWEPGAGRPACAGLPVGAPSALRSTSGRRDSLNGLGADAFTPSTVAPATGAPTGSPAQAGRPAPGPDFSASRAAGPSASAESAASRRGLFPALMRISWAFACPGCRRETRPTPVCKRTQRP